MADEIAKLVDALSSSSDDNLSQRLRFDSSLKLGFHKLYSILNYCVSPIAAADGHGDTKLGLQLLEPSQIQAVASLATAVVHAARSLLVEHVEPVIVAVVQKSVEFALSSLDKSICDNDDSVLQSYMVQLLEMALTDRVDKDLDLLQPHALDIPFGLLDIVALTDDSIQVQYDVNCMLRGGRCSVEGKAVDLLLMTLASERLSSDDVNQLSVGRSSQHDFMKLLTLSRHQALLHWECIQRLVFFCTQLFGLPGLLDENITSANLFKRLSLCLRIFKLLGYLAKDDLYVKIDAALLRSFASFADILPKIFGIGFEFVSSNAAAESSFESVTILLMEEFLQLVQAVFHRSNVVQNIQACITASILDHLDSSAWRYNKSAVIPKPPLAYFPHVVIHMMKLIADVKASTFHVFQLKDIDVESDGCPDDFNINSLACQVRTEKIFLLKKYTDEELLSIIFPSSSQWVDNLIHLVLFLYSEGVKLRPKLERSCSNAIKTSSESEGALCHEDDALFGDLFSEGGRSVGPVEVLDQPAAAASSVSNLSNMPNQAATELLSFLKNNVFCPDWNLRVYEDGCRKLTCEHIGILLSIFNHRGFFSEERASDSCIILDEQKKLEHILELCFELFKNLLSRHALSDVLEEALIEKILAIENGAFVYNDQTLALLAHALISRVGSAGSHIRDKVYQIFVSFVLEKAKTIFSICPSLQELLETLPSVFHIEILLMAFHLSSRDERAAQLNAIFSSLRTIDAPPSDCGTTQLSCWALVVSRLVLMLRHMMYCSHGCPSSLLLEFRSKLKKAPVGGASHSSKATNLSRWTPIMLENVTAIWMKEAPVSRNLLNQLIDITTLPASVFGDSPLLECLNVAWDELSTSVSWILGFWKGKRPGNVEDLIVERYMFVLCWDVPIMESTSEHVLLSLRDLELPDILEMDHFLYFSHSILSNAGVIGKQVNLPRLVMGLLQHFNGLCIADNPGEEVWDFFMTGSWLSLISSLVGAGIWGYCKKNDINLVGPCWGEFTSRDVEFFALSESLISTTFGDDQIAILVRLFSSLLKNYLGAYQKAFHLTFDSGCSSADKFSPLLLLKHTSFDKRKQDEILEKMGYDSCQLESLYRLLPRLGETIDKMVLGHRSKIFWEVSLHGFPCHPQIYSGILLSCILNLKKFILVLDGLLKVKDYKGSIFMEGEVLHQILSSVLAIKCDRVFESLHVDCEAIYRNLSSGIGGPEYSSLFIMKNMEELLLDANSHGVDSSIHECLVTNFIDIINDLRRDPSKAVIFKYFLNVEDVSEQLSDICCALHGDVLVLFDSLTNCYSESVNIKVINFLVDLLSGDMYVHVKQKLQQKFLDMDLLCLSKWLEQRLLGSMLESSSGITCAKGTSVPLRESTMNLIMCLLSPPSDSKSQALHKHLFEAMLIPLDSAFLLFDFGIARSYFNFMLQLSRGEMLIKPLLRHTITLMEKLGGDECRLHGLKYIFGFLATVLSECGSIKSTIEKSFGKTTSGSSSVAGTVTSRPLGSRNSSDALILSANHGAAAAVDCDATSADEDEDDGTSDGEVGSVDKDEEEDGNSEKALASKVCTFTSSGSNFMEQHWYFCYTCDLTVSKGCCSVCAKVCHRGHRVVYSRSSRFFCDCGAGGVRGSSCQCLKPRKFTRGHDSPSCATTGGNLQPFLPFPESGDQLPESDSDVEDDALVEQDYSIKLSIPKEVQDGMPKFLAELNLEDRVLELCSSLLPIVIGRRDSNLSREKKITLGEDKVLCCNGELLQLKKAYKSGSLDLKIKADYSNTKELKSHLASSSLVKSLLSVSSRGRLAVGEGDKVAVFDVGQLIGQAAIAPVTADKANVKPLSKNVVRFEIVHMVFNPVVDNYLAVAGYEDCQVLTVNHRGEVTDRLAIELALQGAYIRRVDWLPGSQVQLMVVTNKFVKIYDLSQDNISPMHYFTLPDDMIVDATLIMVSQGRIYLIVLSESGYLYRLELSMKENVGVKALKEIIQIEGRDIHSKGLSLCFSSSHKLLFVSYQDGTTLIGRLNAEATYITDACALLDNEPEGKARPAGLHHWKELVGGIGLFFCLSSLKSNAAFAVSICENEIHAQNMRHTVGSTSPLVGITAYKPPSKDKIQCLVLHDDGSLQIYWHVPMGVDNSITAISEKVKKLGSGILNNKTYGGLKPEFPLDFFEKTMLITPDVKLSGDAIRNGDSEGTKQTLASEDGFLEGPSSSGFKITVSNSNPDIVMVGLRVHVGNTSANHIPSEITVFQRVIKLDEGMRSWYDIPFTVAESLLADEEFSISVGPTFSGSALPRIDSLEVYGRAKDEFGWKEKMDAILDMEGSKSWVSGSRRKCRATQSAPLQEQVMSDGLKLLSRIYSCESQDCSKVEEANIELNKLKCKKLLERIFESDREPLLLASACHVLQALFPKKEAYYKVKDTMRLSGVVKSTSILSSKLGTGGNTGGWIIEEFTSQMHAVSKIALHRRSNLASFLESNGSEVVDGLMQVLWGIFDVEHPDTQTMNNIVVSSVELIYCYAECLALHANGTGTHAVAPAVSLFKELLFSTNEAVQTSSSLAISSRLLQVPFPKQTMLGTEDVSDTSASAPVRADVTSAATGNTHIMVEEDNITSSVQYCCDGCSTVPIHRRRWHCTVCPDFDLCEACYEVLDTDRLPPPHSRDHPMTAIPIEVESLSGEGNEIHFGADDLGDPNLLTVSADMSVQNGAPSIHELETSEPAEFSGSVFDPVTISASKRVVNSLILSELLVQLKGWMEATSGVQAIPIMQLFFRLSSATGGPFDDGSEPEDVDLEKLVKWFLDEINLNKPFTARNRSPFSEVVILVFMFFTLMLRNWNQPGSDGSVQKMSSSVDAYDKNSVQIPPFSLVSGLPAVDAQEKLDCVSHLFQACGLLRQQAFVNYLMDILQQLVQVFKSSSVSSDSSIGLNTGSGCGSLLTIRRELPAGNFSPFFSDAYAKSHRADIFADYPRLLLENTFRLVYSMIRPEKHDKGGEKDKYFKMSASKDLKLEGYQDILCSYINNPHTTFVRRYARRLFLHLCGSKTHYYSVRDSWQFSSEAKKLYKHITKSGGFQSNISYERSVKIVKCLTTMAEVAAARPRNWQKYCTRHADVLPFLLQGVFSFGEECIAQTLKLLSLAFYTGKEVNQSMHKSEGGEAGTSSNKSASHSADSKKKKKGEDGTEPGSEKSYLDMEPVVDVFNEKDGDTLRQFIELFLLEWNSSSVRVEAKSVLYGIWHHGNQVFKEAMLTALLQKVKCLPMYGQNIIEYTQLVTSLLGRTQDSGSKQQINEIVDKCLTSEVIRCIFETLRSQNELLANHPNSRIYNTLSGLVEFDGYYLESEPCVACSSPEVPYSRMKLESLKSETKFTDNRIIVKCTGSYTIQTVTMNVHEARKSKSVKVLNLYYNNRPVADLSELKNNWSLWKRAKTCHLAFNQTELKVEFPIPITACNFMIELDSFYENLQALSLEPLQCPRCSRPVTDKHGICGNCHENAYQCRQCRNINYENLDSFLCNECGYSKYGRFEFNFMAKPSFTFDNMENDEDMKRGLTAIEAESENAFRRYQQLLGFKKPLLKIVSSIGENEMDSQQKDSVQQMMVSLPGPSCKINRKIALLGVLYGEKCKAAFDSVSKSVQTLQGLRRVLMNYLHVKHSDNAAAASRFVVSRSANSCYGCATTFVAQCLEMLQMLSKHPTSKKQLVTAGILTELFENNIHQGPKSARVQARAALCAFSEGDMNAVAELNSLMQKKVLYCLEHHRSMDIALATREELLLLSDVCSLVDEFWESRLRIAFLLLFSSIKLGAKHPAISEHVILPCLRIISLACTPPKPDAADKEQVNGKSAQVPQVKDENRSNVSGSSGHINASKAVSESSEKNWDASQKTQDIQLLSYSEWEKGASYLDFVRRQYKVSQAVKSGPRARLNRYDYLALKYALRWKRHACKARSEIASFELGSWVTELILSACSQSIRSEMCMLISLLCGQSSSRQYRLLNLLMSLLPATLDAGENAAEYFELFFKMIETEDARLFITVRGGLATICKLITQEVSNIESFERSLHIDISQGFILLKLIELLGKFLEVCNIRSRFMREQLLSEVLEALIVIRGLIVQKTKVICDCNRLLKDLLDSLLLESDENKRQFIQACICGLQIHGEERKGRTSLFILEQLCNLISPSKPEAVYHLILNKAHTQEEFIRGSMTKNPYSSAEIGPLMRDVKNKICHQLELLGLLEDDYGMELLVAGNIISLDLSISQVYEQVWKKSSSQSSNALAGTMMHSSGAAASSRDYPPMTVTYRLQGLDGEATEPMIKELEEEREESQDPEVEFAIAGAVRECGGLEILLGMVQRLRDDLKSSQEQLVAVLNLLMLCCKKRENRRALLKLGALSLLLETARHAFFVDAMEPAEGILLIVESLTLEANESDNISIEPGVATVSSEDAGASEQAKKIVLMFLERLSHPIGLKKSSKQQRNTEMVARILPYLTYGEPAAMEALIDHFNPYLQNWSEFDKLQRQYEDNPKDESIAQQANRQKFALENFIRVSESLKTSSCGERLKDIILDKGITGAAVRHLKDTFAYTGQSDFRSCSEWVLGRKLPSVPVILSMLRGLSLGHLATQVCIDEGGILPLLHALEGVPGLNEIGARAENLLDTLCDKEGTGDGFLSEKVSQLRHATRDEMRRLALRNREEVLKGMGWRRELSSDGGERIVVSQPVLEGLEEVEEEEVGLACMVCREGYRLRPTDLLGVYTYSKRVNLGAGTSGNARGDCVYTTVSHFNIIHFQCHQEAKRADAALRTPKKEWDGAALRNNETLCNNLFPLRGPSVPVSQYVRYVDQYWDYLNALGRADGSRLRLLTYDIVLMLARFATGALFNADCRGGGKESNSRFLPFMIQMAHHFLDHDPSQRLAMDKSISTYLASSTLESKSSIPGTQPSTGTEETVQFMMVSSLLSESYESWLQHRRAFLQRGIYHAYMQRTHGKPLNRLAPSLTSPPRSDIGSSSTSVMHPGDAGGPGELLSIIQPMLVYTGLIEQLQRFFKVKKSSSVATVQSQIPSKALEAEDESKRLEIWEVFMKERLLNVKEMVGFSKELLSWLDDMTSATDLQEAFDIIGMLADVLTGGFTRCEEFVYAAINTGRS